ncbi:Prefoldin [Penicillium camemberti]|uniref:Prefoldin n=1 Tax=Penicillium camemberti (strain FM 013) TaxID=1429867 RepID=A0A0G4PL18_PENC3|nr:Prefoldin [Penicillium camemberti]
MGVPNPNLDALEEQRLALEENILQLQKSLYHWRTWEAEYDGLREEISNLEDDASTDDFFAVALEFGGTLVDHKEMQTILGSRGVTRSRGQVVDLLGRRIDYVQQNVATMEKRLSKAQNELDALVLNDQPPLQDGAEFPMQEIMEELDEDGNVVSSKINTPGNDASELLEVLKKAGVKDIPETSEPEKTTATPADATREGVVGEPVSSTATDQQNGSSGSIETTEPTGASLKFSQPQSVVTAEDRMQPPVTDVNESAEEARLRREMLDYGINEVGAIVAELEMDESGSDISFDEDYDYDYDEEDNEDEHGRSHTRLPAEYHQQMMELEAKLNARGLMNMGKDTETFPEEVQQEIAAPSEVETSSQEKEKKPKKRVAFADDLDIAPAPASPITAEKAPASQAEPQVLADSIVERTSRAPEPSPATPAVPKKTSRFKSARAAAPGSTASESITAGATIANPSEVTESRLRKQANTAPSVVPPVLFPATPKEPKPFSAPISDIVEKPPPPQFPHDRTLAEKVFERQVKTGAAVAPELDPYDEELHQKQIASEFFNMQKRMNGTSKDDEEQDTFPPEEDQPRRVSKFKASRMG